MLENNLSILCWNVRGLNCPNRRATVHETIAASSCHLVCIQDSKLQNVDPFVATYLGGQRLKNFAQRPADGTKGGILLLWDESTVSVTDVQMGVYFLSASVALKNTSDPKTFKLTTVYGPTRSNNKDAFFLELSSQKPPPGTRWLVNGDFNQIYRARDKNRANVDRSRLVRFRNTLNACELKEIHLQNRRFTWSNEQNNPTLCKLDSFFCNANWDIKFVTHILHALSSSLSDHCHLLLANNSGPKRPKSFRFENHWIKMPGFQNVVNAACNEHSAHVEPFQRLFHKLKKTSQKLRKWSKTLFAQSKIQLHMALEVIIHLDLAQEQRVLSPDERDLQKRLKRKAIGLAVLEKAHKCQNSRITNLKEGDANTRYFHLRVNHRRRKNFIHCLKHNNGWVTEHGQKENIVHQHFTKIAKKGPPRNIDINWEILPTPGCDLRDLDEPFSEEEVKAAVFDMPGDKAPGPDGFTSAFFKACSNTVKDDIMMTINHFASLHASHFHWLNFANVALLPKKDGAEDITDFRPISLIHAVAKIIAKLMSNRLAPHMNDLVSQAQSAFIKTRCIHDNFMYVRNIARRIHRKKTPALLFKLDIKKRLTP